nr:MAG TPA: hypothetical protein [Caudoviricetes sp.]
MTHTYYCFNGYCCVSLYRSYDANIRTFCTHTIKASIKCV